MKPKTLYLSYTGLLEPLGRSQVLAYLSRLSSQYSITLITFEKEADLLDKNELDRLKKECIENDLNWKILKYHKKPLIISTLYDFFVLFIATCLECFKNNIKLIHSRSYITSTVAWLAGKITRTPFIFDMRALWLNELIDAGKLKYGSLPYQMLRFIEKKLLTNANSVVSLTEAAVPYIKEKNPQVDLRKFTVIPTCVDLSRFQIGSDKSNNKFRIGTIGSVLSGWFLTDEFQAFIEVAFQHFPETVPTIITKDEFNDVSACFQSNQLDWDIFSVRPSHVSMILNEFLFAVLFFTPGDSKIGSAPTRLGEMLACGIPVICNNSVGDMAEIVNKYNVGIVIDDFSESGLKAALVGVSNLLLDPQFHSRCGLCVENEFSLEKGVQLYKKIYSELVCDL
jgi:glycosyltransferase involved in cell wall biosynthesis